MDTATINQVGKEDPTERDKAINLFTYLKDICTLRISQVHNVASYDQVFWFSDVPHHKLCRCSAWHFTNPEPVPTEKSSDFWIEIRKPPLKSPPELPDELEPWIKNEDEIKNSALESPSLFEEIPLSALQTEEKENDPNIIAKLSDYPQIISLWENYIETKWKPWALVDRELQQVAKAYNVLFNIYQRQEKLGEQYEVIVGIGLLLWRSPNSGEVKRHILALQARIEFDRFKGIMSVGPAIDGPQAALEYVMLDPHDMPNITDLNNIEKDDVEVLNIDPWDSTNLERLMHGFANSLPTTGNYISSFEQSGGATEKPIVKLAPAVILRKRTHRAFVDFYQKMIDQIQEGGKISENIRRIIEIIDSPSGGEKEIEETETSTTTSQLSDIELYFPLPANDEQKRIVQKLEHSQGVLVQGPPGTGKSHTICNLIAHYLAKGSRILVTSETPRALEVLRRKLHKDMRAIEELCVVWLGSGPESQRALEKSVLGITHRKSNWNAPNEHKQTENLTHQLDEERKEQKKLYLDLRACKESDVNKHTSVFNHYSGTLQQIALQIHQDHDRFKWFLDRPRSEVDLNLNSDDLIRMAQIHRKLTNELVEQIKRPAFPQEKLVQTNEYCRLVEAEKKSNSAFKELQSMRTYPGYSQMSVLDREKRRYIKENLENILATQDNLLKYLHSWVKHAFQEIASGQDHTWRHIYSLTTEQINQIERLVKEYGELETTGLDTRNLQIVAEHANKLKNHLEKGKGLGFWFIRSRDVKNGLYLVKSVTVNGKLCDNVQVLKQLIAWIEISTRIKSLSVLWNGVSTPPTGRADLQCSAYHSLCEPIKSALGMYDLIKNILQTCSNCNGIRFPAWHSQEEVRAFYNALDARDVEEDFLTAQSVFDPLADAITDFINSARSNPLIEKLQQAVKERDCVLYRETVEALSLLQKWVDDYRFASEVHSRFRACAPKSCAIYDDSYSDMTWDDHFAVLAEAWVWAKTDRWFDEISDRERPKNIMRALELSSTQEKTLLQNLSGAKAWQHCIQRMKESERQALIAWKQIVDHKIRGGHGKYVERYREEARQKFDEAKSAIPAWVMPLYQVVQTVHPKPKQFDLVIIDEASQSGPEAILLNYIADKIIVVGDDKQITPMNVGIDKDRVDFFAKKYLQDIPQKETLGLEGSLFSQAELRFPDRIRLREHFRCMPEIIQFSNNISYPNEPLIPLRQYSADRLPPVQAVFVKDGYRRGHNEKVENQPEAREIVTQIAECCENPAYSNKTFGVICLMGGRQAEIINSLLVDEIGPEEIEKRRLVCGRPYDFQGDERDIIFLSMVEAPEEGQICRMVRDPDTQRRFNVAASRARDQLWLFHSVTLNDLRPECLRYRLLQYCLNPAVMQPDEIGETKIADLRRQAANPSMRQTPHRGRKIPRTPFDSWFEVDVFLKIIDKGYRVLPQFNVNTRYIDLVVEGLRGRLAVECDGDEYHGLEQWEADSIRQRELERCGWTFCRIRGSDFYRNQDTALVELWQTLEKLKILPRHLWDEEQKRKETKEIEETSEIKYAVRSVSRDEVDEEQKRKETEETSDIRFSIRPVHIGKAEEEISDLDEEEFEEESSSTDDVEGRLDRVLEQAKELSRRRMQQDLPPIDIQNAIVSSLKKCPNQTCTLKSITSRVLKEIGILTRGNPRLEFERRVMRNLGVLKRKNVIVEYKSKNKRIRIAGQNDGMLPL